MINRIICALSVAVLVSCTRTDPPAPSDLGVPSDLGPSVDLDVSPDLDAACPAFVPPDLGDRSDAGDGGLADRVSVSPDGMGYCCEPLRWGVCGNPGFYPGGYGANPDDCLGYNTDASWTCTTLEFVDEHGCVYLDIDTALSCNAPPPP